MAEPIRLITFDLDDTLWSVQEVMTAANGELRRWLQKQVPGFSELFDDERMARLRQALIQQSPQLRHDLSALRVAVLTQALIEFGQSQREAKNLAESAFAVFLHARHQVRYYPSIEHTLSTLAGRYTLAALSNGNADVARLRVGAHFSFSYSAASVGSSKPDPAMFKAALERAQVPAAAAIHIGDHLVDDVRGAQRVGMRTIWLDHGHSRVATEPLITPEVRVTDVSQICAAIAALDPS